MRSLFLAFFVFLGLSSSLSAQRSTPDLSFGLKTSIGISLASDEYSFAGEAFDQINHEIKFTGTNIAKSIGIFGQQKVGYLYGRAELSYAQYTQNYRVRSFVAFGQGTEELFEKFQFVDFQLMGGVTHNGVRLGVGPVAHILVGHTPALDFISGYSDNNRPITFGFTTAVGIDAGKFSIDFRYVNNFRTIGEHINYGARNSGYKAKPHMVNITVGYSI